MEKSLARNAVSKLTLNIFNIVIPLLVGAYLSRTFGPAVMGDINYIQSLYTYLVVFSNFGVYQYGLRELSRVRDDRKKFDEVFSNLFFIILVANLVVILLYLAFISILYPGTRVSAIGYAFTLNFVANFFFVDWVMEAREDFGFITRKSIVIQTIYAILIFIFIRSADNYVAYGILVGIALFFNYLTTFVYLRTRVKLKMSFRSLRLKDHLKPMFVVVIFSNAGLLFIQLDKIMIGAFMNRELLSYYTMAHGIMLIINTLMLTVVHVTIPRLNKYLSDQNHTLYDTLLNRIFRVYLMFLFPAAVGLSLVAREAILIYGGSQFVQAIPILSMFAVYMVVLGLENILTNQIMYVKRQEKVQVRIVFLCGFLNLLFNIGLITLGAFTPMAALVTTTIANGLLVAAQYWYIRVRMKFHFIIFSMTNMKYLFFSLVFIPVTYLIRSAGLGTLLNFVLIITVNTAIYLLMLFLTKEPFLGELMDMVRKKRVDR